jgi:hypothetical protein
MLDRTEAAQILEIVDVDMPVVDLVAALPKEIADHVLARPLGAAGGGYRDKIACGRKLRIEAGIDGVEDFPLDIANIHRVIVPILCCIAKTAPARSNHILPGIAEVLDRFQNRARAHTLPAKISRPVERPMPANRNVMYLIIGALIVAVGVLGYNLYQTKKEPEGLQINVGPSGLKIQNK